MENINLDEALFYSKLIIKKGDCYSGKSFRKYSKAFIGASEDIKFYLEQESFNRKRALTVLGAGDHVFNLAFMDVKEIDAFDINMLQYFVYYLRKAMLDSLMYEEFKHMNLRFDSYAMDGLAQGIEKSKKILREDVYEYYRKILEFARKIGRLENLYYFVIGDFWRNYNNYLQSEETYLALREKLKNTKVNLYFGDVRDISKNLKGDYDIALLSNISDYLGSEKRNLTIEEFDDFIDLFYNLLSDNGVLINYLYGFKDEFLIKNSMISRREIPSNNLVKIDFTNMGYYRVRKIT